MPDVPHLLKNLRNHLLQGQEITLPQDLAKQLKLPGRTASVQPIKWAVEVDVDADLKLAPHLKEACVQSRHFEKMKVGFAFTLFNNDTAAALHMPVEAKDDQINNEDALTTAWFVETVFRWFKLMSSRTTKLAISHFDEQQYEETVTFLKGMTDLFEKNRNRN